MGGLPKRVTFEQQCEGDERGTHVDIKEKNWLSNKGSLCKGPEAEKKKSGFLKDQQGPQGGWRKMRKGET